MKLFKPLGDFLKIVGISLLIIIPIRYYIAQPFFVRGASMDPTFEDGEYLIIDEISYRLNNPERGEVIVFRFPLNTSQFYIKRIVGMPGETVRIQDGKVRILMDAREISLDESMYLGVEPTTGDLELTLGEDEYFVMGDNRGASSDSRRWGALKDSFIIGKVFLRAWPFSRFTLFK